MTLLAWVLGVALASTPAGAGGAAAAAPPPAAPSPALAARCLHAAVAAPPPRPEYAWPARIGLFAAGAASGFVSHELGHVFANLVAGNVPHLVGLRGLGFVPFFAISPDIYCAADGSCIGAQGQRFAGGRRGQYSIATAGFNVQHLANEVLLGQAPNLRRQQAPYAKGWLFFNLALSTGYAVASLAHVEDVHGDAGGAAYYAQVPRAVVAALLLAPAAIDLWRYLRPGDRWAPWVGRVSKVGLVGLSFST